jgi:hypothetical protein
VNEGGGEGFFYWFLLFFALAIGLGELAIGVVRKKKSITIIGGFVLAIPVVLMASVLLVNAAALLARAVGDGPSSTTVTAPAPSESRQTGVRGLDAVPPGFALVVEGESKEGSTVPRVRSVIIPELGVFRMELAGHADPAEMVITVRTPDRELGYRGQAVFSGRPRPMDMAFLISPLTYPSSWTVAKSTRTGNHISAVLTRGTPPASEEYAIEADLDQQTGIIVSEQWADQYVTRSITRRLVPLSSIETPRLEEVLAFAKTDWQKTIAAAGALPYPVLGVDLPFLQPHMLQSSNTKSWLDYSASDQPGRLAV